ncbi:MAG: hypothetical protein JXR03_01035 [Cyclobacteriaceae bacterium]
MKLFLITWLVFVANSQNHQEQIVLQDTLEVDDVSNLTVVVHNVFGEIEVKQGKADQVEYEIIKTISSHNLLNLSKGMEEVKMNVLRRNDSIIFYITAPFICDKWNPCARQERQKHEALDKYDFRFDCSLTIPALASIDVGTVKARQVSISGVKGKIKANNVDGDVRITGARSVSNASTVNGEVNVWFELRPDSNGEYSTINGDINIYCDDSFNASIKAKSLTGSLYSAFEYQMIKPRLNKVKNMDGKPTTYHLEESCGIEIGHDGPLLSFETFNGDIYLRHLK